MKREWATVETTDYYHEYYEAVLPTGPAKGFNNGHKVEVEWPNGKVTEHDLIVKTDRGSAQVDMNNYPDHFDTRDLFVRIPDFNGYKITVNIKGMKIRSAK